MSCLLTLAGLRAARSRLDRLRAGIGRVDKQVRASSLTLPAGAGTRGKGQRGARRPYSLLLAEPFIKVLHHILSTVPTTNTLKGPIKPLVMKKRLSH